VHFGQFDREPAHVDAIQAQQGALGGEAPAWRIEAAECPAEDLGHPEAMGQ
jgi:hypothetical protein